MKRSLLAAAASAAALLVAAPMASASSYTDNDYWAFADRMEQTLDSKWDPDAGYYQFGGGGVAPMANSMMLLTHSVAAMHNHVGPARNDARARELALKLVSSGPGPFVNSPAPGQSHAPGWVNAMTGRGTQHLVFDAEVVDGLVYAYRAREALQLPDSTVAKIRDAIHRTARGKFWRYPTIRL